MRSTSGITRPPYMIAVALGAISLLTVTAAIINVATSSGALVNTMTVDLDAGAPGIQSTRTVASGASLDIAIVAENVTDAYTGYGWELQWDDAELNFVSNTENSAGHGGNLCAAAATTTDPGAGVPPGKEWAGQGAGCLRSSGTTTFAGPLVTITIQCVADGETEVKMVPLDGDPSGQNDAIFGSSFIGGGGSLLPTAFNNATLTCGSVVPPTNTPTNTPVPATNTPTNTPVPATNTPTNTPVPPTNTPAPNTNTPTNTPAPNTNTPTSTPTPGGCNADRNGDGKVTLADLLIVLRSLHNDHPRGDVDGDGDVDARDVALVIRALIRGGC